MIGWLIGVVVSWLTIRWSIRRLVRLPVGRLLAGATDGELAAPERGPKRRFESGRVLRVALVAAGGRARASSASCCKARPRPAFSSAAGRRCLRLLLGEIRYRLRASAGAAGVAPRRFRCSALGAEHGPQSGPQHAHDRPGGGGEFLDRGDQRVSTRHGRGRHRRLRARRHERSADSFRPQHAGRAGASWASPTRTSSDARRIGRVYSLRVAAGEDASCLNLYRPTQPRVLGVPESLIERGGFGWADDRASGYDKDESVDAARRRTWAG